jgi:hypothetical protein
MTLLQLCGAQLVDLVGGVQIPGGDAGSAVNAALHSALDGLHILTQGPVKCLLAGYAHAACEVSGLHPASPGGAAPMHIAHPAAL